MTERHTGVTRTGRVFFVADFSGPVAATREKGRKVAARLTDLAEEWLADGVDLVEVSFKGVEVASAPFLQPLVRAVMSLRDKAVYSCLNEDVHATLTYVEESIHHG